MATDRYLAMVISTIDRARWELSKTTLIVFIGRGEAKILTKNWIEIELWWPNRDRLELYALHKQSVSGEETHPPRTQSGSRRMSARHAASVLRNQRKRHSSTMRRGIGGRGSSGGNSNGGGGKLSLMTAFEGESSMMDSDHHLVGCLSDAMLNTWVDYIEIERYGRREDRWW